MGGKTPNSGRHVTIESPAPVRRVAPPSTTMTNTIAAQQPSHTATARLGSGFGAGVAATLAAIVGFVAIMPRRGLPASPGAVPDAYW